MTTHRTLHAGLAFLLLAPLYPAAAAAPAATYPTKPIRFVVPAPPGGSLDVIARPVATRLSDALGQQVIVDNRSGAAGIIGSDLVAKAVPDGYTLLMTNLAFAITPALQKKMPYDAARDFTPVSQLTRLPYLFVTPPNVPANSLREFIALAKQKPRELTYASLGNGSGSHLTAVLMTSMAGIELIHVPYKGFGPLMPDLVSGRVHMLFNTIPSVLPHVRAGRLKALFITSEQRSSLLPEIPTSAESGLPGFRVTTWHGVFGTAGMPQPVIARLNEALAGLVKSPQMKDLLANAGAEPVGSSSAEFTKFFRQEMATWARVVKTAGVTVD